MEDQQRTTMVAAIAVLATLAVVGVVFIAYRLGAGPGGDDPVVVSAESTTTSTSTSTTTTTTVTVVTPPPPPTPPSTIGDVRGLPAGFFCRDINARGYSYSAAVDYWRVHGQPDRMDADRDGIPCETVYPAQVVLDYWGTLGQVVVIDEDPDRIDQLPAGLLCRDLRDRGIDVYGALSYYALHGQPDNMDADRDGIPCETVWDDAQAVWEGWY